MKFMKSEQKEILLIYFRARSLSDVIRMDVEKISNIDGADNVQLYYL
jgi:hypothetical protein